MILLYRDYAPNHTLLQIYCLKTITAYSVSKNCGLGTSAGSLVGPKILLKKWGNDGFDLGISSWTKSSIAALETKPEWLPGLLETARYNQSLIKAVVDKILV